MMEGMNGFVAGITNPRFVELPCWDVCCDIETGKITVNKNLKAGNAGVMMNKDAQGSENSVGGGIRLDGEAEGAGMASTPAAKMSAMQKLDCVDNQFMEEVSHRFLLDILSKLTHVDLCCYFRSLWRTTCSTTHDRLYFPIHPISFLSRISTSWND